MDETSQDTANAYLPEPQVQPLCGIEEGVSSSTPQTNFLDLPNEIIVHILGGLEEDEDLYHIGLLSRRLNFLSLPLYLSRRNFGSRPTDEFVFYDYNTPDVIKALNAALFKPSLTRLQYSVDYDESHERLINGLQRLRGVIDKLSSLQEVTFDFHGIPNESSPNVVPLLDSILSLGCESLEFSHNGFQLTEMYAMNGIISDRPLGFIEKWKNHTLPFIPALLYPSKTSNSQGKQNNLQSFLLHSPVLFHPLIFPWTIHVFGISNVTTLSISQQLWVHENSWESILPYLTLPTLNKLNLNSCLIRLQDLMKFFKRHKSLRKLSFGPTFDLAGAHDPLTVGGFQMNLTDLSAFPHSLVKVLDLIPQVIFTSSLNSIAVPLRIPHGESFDLGLMDEPLETFFWRLKIIKEVHLVLVFSGIPPEWIVHDIGISARADHNHNQVHTLVTRLHIHVKVYHLPFSSALKIRAMLAKFPILTHLTIRTMSTVDCSFQYQQGLFTRLMQESCPSLETISFP